jgi:8-oxo-dGTP pyrophosphatase MutT (NUDIX family)
METDRVRNAARALLVTPDREILLMRYAAVRMRRYVWITPGGGIEAGETARDAALREVAEETGLVAAPLGPAVWTRRVRVPWAEPPFVQSETYFWTPVVRFVPSCDAVPTELERREIGAYRWWRLEDIEASTELFAPRKMASLLRELFDGGLPSSPVVAE